MFWGQLKCPNFPRFEESLSLSVYAFKLGLSGWKVGVLCLRPSAFLETRLAELGVSVHERVTLPLVKEFQRITAKRRLAEYYEHSG